MKIYKRFKSAYVLDEAKLRRMLAVLNQAFSESGTDYDLLIKANHPQQKETTVNSLEQLLLLDNSKKYPIESLRITAATSNQKTGADELPCRHDCEIFFSGADSYPSVYYEVSSSDTGWVNNCSALLVEQIERTFQSIWFMKLKTNSTLNLFIPIMLLMTVFMVSLSFFMKSPERLSNQMWLTDSDIAQISKSEEPVTPTQLLNIQIKNIKDFRVHSKLKWLKDWRVYAAFSPIVIVLICLAYLYFKCYPLTVFNWGDMGDHYEVLIGRRKILWSAVIIGVFVGLIANLAVYGLVDLSRN